MGNINLSVDGSTAFGGTLPSVFIEGIEIDVMDTASPEYNEPGRSARITAKLNIKFTKPTHISEAATKQFIEESLGDLKLYVWLSWFDSAWALRDPADSDDYTGDTNFNSMLENGTLNLKDFLTHREDKAADYTTGTDTGSWPSYDIISLGDLIAAGSVYNSQLILSDSYDSRGNEIIQISNIEVKLGHLGFEGTAHPILTNIKKLFLITAVGHNIPELEAASYTEGDDETGALPRNSLNNFFGNITYTHLLKNDKIPSQFYQMYTFADGSPFYGAPLQALDGTYHATDSYDFESVKASFQNLISEYSDIRERDNTLDNNIRTLEAIISAENNKTYVLGEISNYRSVYPNKGQNSESGKFYSAFILAMAEVMTQLNAQPQLTAKLLYDSLIIDNRLADNASGEYSPPAHPLFVKGALAGAGGHDLAGVSEDFLPSTWFQCARKTKLHALAADSGHLAETYLGSDETPYAGAEGSYIGVGAGHNPDEYAELLSSLTAFYMAGGLTESEAADLAYEEANYILSEDSSDLAAAGDLFDPTDTVESGDYLASRSGDTIVQNKGLFMFDWEKAIRTKSNVGIVLDLSLIEKYFNFTIPYGHYRVSEIEMTRRELPVGIDLDGIDAEDRWVEATQTLKLKPTYQYPINLNSEYSFRKGSNDVDVDVDGPSGDAGAKYKYGRPVVLLSGYAYYHSAYLKVVNFDVANAIRAQRLEGFNDATYQTDIVETVSLGSKVHNGYRLMCFEFNDFMDDDVAYYNTWYGADDTRMAALRRINAGASASDSESQTVYRTTVTMLDDNTIDFYNDFVEYIELSYNAFLEYTSESAEICSYNNITNSYNQFFIDAIHEKYAGDSVEKPWLKAAYAIMALGEIIFGSTSSSLEAFNEEVFRYALQISPETGNLGATQNALKRFNTLIRHLKPSITAVEGAVEPPATDPDSESTPFNFINKLMAAATPHSYANYFPIDQPIFGDFFTYSDDTDADPRPAAPEVIVSSENYEPIGNSDHTFWSAYTEANALPQAIIEVFFPRVFGSDIRWNESWRYNMMNLYGVLGDPAGRLAHPPYRSGDEMSEADWEMSFGTAPADFLDADGETAPSKAQIIVNQIFRRSTMDVKIVSETKAKLRYYDDRLFRLRNGRSLNGLLKLLRDYRAEVQSWIDTGGGPLAGLYHHGRLAPGGGSYWVGDDATDTVDSIATISSDAMADYFPDIEAILSELIRNVSALVGLVGSGSTDDFDPAYLAAFDQYKLLAMMNASSPGGPGDFVDIVD